MSLTSKGCFKIASTSSGTPVEFKPKSLKQDFESLASEDSGRTDDGVMHIYWVFKKIRKIEITMAPMTAAQATTLLSMVQGQEYYLTYWDILNNSEKTIHVYTSTSSGDCYSGRINNDGLYQGISFNAIELAGEN